MRGELSNQLMSDLPMSRTEETPPFQCVGLDVFGPYLTHDGICTRSTKATKKV